MGEGTEKYTHTTLMSLRRGVKHHVLLQQLCGAVEHVITGVSALLGGKSRF